MNDRVFLSWNITNWITVVLMATLGFMLLNLITKQIANMRAANAG